ncbi:MAG: type II 3-dehydroquinate dehydratase [Pseudomonadota bacterium]
MSRTIHVLNGPNLNLLGTREPAIYGHETLEDVERLCRDALAEGFGLRFRQSNHEGELVEWIQEARELACGIVINPAAYSHSSIAILDALMAFEGPVMEVHISNIHQRESFRHHSHVSARADGVIAGFGIDGYGAAIRRICSLVSASGG